MLSQCTFLMCCFYHVDICRVEAMYKKLEMNELSFNANKLACQSSQTQASDWTDWWISTLGGEGGRLCCHCMCFCPLWGGGGISIPVCMLLSPVISVSASLISCLHVLVGCGVVSNIRSTV